MQIKESFSDAEEMKARVCLYQLHLECLQNQITDHEHTTNISQCFLLEKTPPRLSADRHLLSSPFISSEQKILAVNVSQGRITEAQKLNWATQKWEITLTLYFTWCLGDFLGKYTLVSNITAYFKQAYIRRLFPTLKPLSGLWLNPLKEVSSIKIIPLCISRNSDVRMSTSSAQ